MSTKCIASQQDPSRACTTVLFPSSESAEVTIIDYSSLFVRKKSIKFPEEPLAPSLSRKPSAGLRWIVVNGTSLHALKEIMSHHSIDEISADELITRPQRTKMESFSSHTFCYFPLHYFHEQEVTPSSSFLQKLPDFCCSRSRLGAPEGLIFQRNVNAESKRVVTSKSQLSRPKEIAIEHVSLIFGSDVVITVFESAAESLLNPILNRLQSPSTLIRQESTSLSLVQSILDASVDLIGIVAADYRRRLTELQYQASNHPTTRQTYHLYRVTSDIRILRESTFSIRSLISKIYHRTQYLPDSTSEYLLAVVDHAQCHLDEFNLLDSYAGSLSSLVFRTMEIHASNSMLMLSVVSVVFMPLTFLAGYFGMNFKTFDVLKNNPSYFWMIAAPAAAALFALLMYPIAWDLIVTGRRWLSDEKKKLLEFEKQL